MSAPTFRMRPLALKDVALTEGFWASRQETNRRVTLPIEYAQCKKTGRIDAWKLDWQPGEPNPPHIFWDSDVAKWIEAAAYSLALHPDRRLKGLVDAVIEHIAAAQQPDGYLNVHFSVVETDKRWTNLRDWHELYSAGHLMEAAVAYCQATGENKLLATLCRYADHIGSVFGPDPGQKRGYPGHEEIELALVKLYRATGYKRYLHLAKYFLDERGRQPHYYKAEAEARREDPQRTGRYQYEYNQSHLPVRRQSEVVGHAVRAFYLYSGMADVAGETGDADLLAACRRLWRDATQRKLYVTGGLGPSSHNEGFTRAYDLPNQTAYAETCAAIALVFFAHRMVQIEADAHYADTMELALYNGVLSGVSHDGERFFYVNPLASAGQHHRQEWFGCACCPPNVARLIASIGQYACSAAAKALYVHLYAAGSASAEVAARKVTLTQRTDYPWAGEVAITVDVDQPATFDLMLRIPGWCRKHTVALDGRKVAAPIAKGYARIRRRWTGGETVTLSLAMPVERMVAHPSVAEDAGKVALQRGPIVFCLEGCDHAVDVRSIRLPDRAKLTARFDPKLLGGATVIEAAALAPATAGWKGKLYRPAGEQALRPVKIKAIPYHLWDNRKPGPMTVWLARA